jgi:hypothetical protein
MLDTLGRSYQIPKDPTGIIVGTARELDVLQCIYRFPYIPTSYLDHYFQLSYYAKEVCAELFAKDYVQKNYLPSGMVAWSLTTKGIKSLRKYHPTELFIPQGTFNPHQVYSTLIGCSFAFATHEIPELQLLYPEHYLTYPDIPKLDPNGANPFIYHVGNDKLIADARPFKLKLGKLHMCFWGFEADRNNATIQSDKATSAIRKKYKKQQAMLVADHAFKTFRMRNLTFAYVTINATHEKHLIEELERTVSPQWHDHFIFATFRYDHRALDLPEPSARLVTQDWHQTKGRTYNIITVLKGELKHELHQKSV